LIGWLVAALPARGQTIPAWTDRGYVGVDGGAQVTTTSFQSTFTFTAHAEEGRFAAGYKIATGPVVSARGGIRLWRNLAVGVGVTAFSRTGNADVSAEIPHPFYFNQFRSVSGTASGLKRNEVAVSLDVGWRTVLGRRIDMMVFGGPAFFTVKQDLATQVRFSESYPYDTASFVGADSKSTKASVVGFSAGVDVSCMITKSVGFGAIVRISHARAQLSPASGQTIRVDAGGVQAGGGLRVRF
jgi:hypothetical protein